MSDYSDDEPEVTPELIAHLKATEHRYADIAAWTDLETDMRDNATIKALLAAAEHNFEVAVLELIDASPADRVTISRCIVNIKTFVVMKRTLNAIRLRGRESERSLRAEDQQGGEF